MRRLSYLSLLSVLLFAGCGNRHRQDLSFHPGAVSDSLPVKFAQGFSLSRQGGDFLLTISNPWQNASHIEYHYLLSDTLSHSVIRDENHILIKTPVKRIICLSTTHLGFIGFLGKIQTVVGVSGKKYVVNPQLQDEIAHDRIADVGYDENLNYELILKLKPDLVLAYGVNSGITGILRKLNEAGIPTLLIGEYLEEEPLAKMEWVKVFGALFDEEQISAQKFDSVAYRYQKLKQLTRNVIDKPTVLLGLPWRGTWYVSGGQSYVARLISDAGGTYLFRGLDYKDSRPVSLETVYEKGLTAKFWLNTGDAGSRRDLLSVDERFGALPAVKEDNLYNNNRLMSPGGGNAFFESGVTEPDSILADIICILHPHLLPSHRFKYYRKLQ